MTASAAEIKRKAKEKGDSITAYNHGVATNFLMSPPLADENLRFDDVFANPFIVAIVEGASSPFLPLLPVLPADEG
jgi:hypothetical protein